MTTMVGDCEPVEVVTLDVVGYKSNGTFVILNPVRNNRRKLPHVVSDAVPFCFLCTIKNNQVVNFEGDVATLHDIDGKWYYKRHEPNGQIRPLEPDTFFEIGCCR